MKKISAGTPGERIAELQVGCTLLTINGSPVDDISFAQAGPLVQERPLKLIFAKQRTPAEGSVEYYHAIPDTGDHRVILKHISLSCNPQVIACDFRNVSAL